MMSSVPAIATLALGAAALAGEPASFAPQPLLMVGDVIPGLGAVEGFHDLEVGADGSWLAHVTVGGAGAVLRDGAVVYQQGQLVDVPAPTPIEAFGPISLADAGAAVALRFFGGSAVALDDVVLAANGDALLDGPGHYKGLDWAVLGGGDAALGRGEVILPGEPVADTLLRWQLGPGGLLGTQIVAREGQAMPGFSGPVDLWPDSVFDVNPAGQVIWAARFTDTSAVFVDDQSVATEGQAIPGAGESWRSLYQADVRINADGAWSLLSLDSDFEWCLFADGAVLALTGESLPAPDGQLLAGIDRGYGFADDGSVLWMGDWSGPQNTNRGLFLGRSLIVREGVTPVAGSTVDEFWAGGGLVRPTALSEDGHIALFAATLTDGRRGCFRIDLDPWVDLGGGLAGTGGVAPLLTASGSMTAASQLTYGLSGGPAAASAWLVLGGSELSAPFRGGTLVPAVGVVVPFTLDGSGASGIGFQLPEPLAGGTTVYAQAWVEDAGGPLGLAATNAVVGTTLGP